MAQILILELKEVARGFSKYLISFQVLKKVSYALSFSTAVNKNLLIFTKGEPT